MSNLYRKLAWINIKSSRQFYLPYLLTGILSATMFYCMRAIQGNKGLATVRGGMHIRMILNYGTVVTGIFVGILLFYTNSFIMKRRKKELGVYNILGMEKRHIAKVMLWEIAITFAISTGGGILCGIMFHKLLTMFLYWLTGLEERIPFYISGNGCLQTVELFGMIYVATFLYDFMQIQLANPIELLRSTSVGEREPKTKTILSAIGIACIGTAYYISLTTEKPLETMVLFFVAVLLVIIGTYCLFTAGSIAFLKMLRKNKKYYYQTRHFTAVSGMIYRMKQNAVGLANICILSTMVLVVISTTVSVYVGLEDELNDRYPAELGISFSFTEVPQKDTVDCIYQTIGECIENNGRTMTERMDYTDMGIAAYLTGNEISLTEGESDYSLGNVIVVNIITQEDYEKIYGDKIAILKDGEIALASSIRFSEDSILFCGQEYQIAEKIALSARENEFNGIIEGIYLIVRDKDAFREIIREVTEACLEITNRSLPRVTYRIDIEIDGAADEKIACAAAVREQVAMWKEDGTLPVEMQNVSFSMESRQEGAKDFMVINGSLFFLGLFLGSMFLMVTVLIIYYKQISEGYEDRERFVIMQKVGMSSDEVRGAIRVQVQTVFFLPLVTAAVHLAAAFPMLRRLLALLNLTNATVFVWCLAGTVAVFAIIYLSVFLVTSRSYYRIVGNHI